MKARSRAATCNLAVALTVALIAALGLPSSVLAAPTLSPAGNVDFPERAYIVTLPESARLGARDVQVTENGGPVRGLRIRSAGAARLEKLGVALAIDSSGSMRGQAYEGAFSAARAFAEQRNESQPLALVTFGSEIGVPMRFTTARYRIDAVFENPGAPAGGTHLYDGALRAVELIENSSLPGGFVVILSDGADHGSSATAAEVVAAARAARVRLYTVGLRSPRFDPAALEDLAEGTEGRYSEVSSPDELNAIYSELGAELSNAHLLTYRSLAGPRVPVEVAVQVQGQGTATSSYMTPRLIPQGVGKSIDSNRWESPLAVALGAAVFAGLVGLAVLLFLRRRGLTARDRVERYVRRRRSAGRRRGPERPDRGRRRAISREDRLGGRSRT